MWLRYNIEHPYRLVSISLALPIEYYSPRLYLTYFLTWMAFCARLKQSQSPAVLIRDRSKTSLHDLCFLCLRFQRYWFSFSLIWSKRPRRESTFATSSSSSSSSHKLLPIYLMVWTHSCFISIEFIILIKQRR